MMRGLFFFTVFVLMVALFGCQERLLNKEELTQYMLTKENGLVKSASSGDLNIEVYYRPRDLVIDQMRISERLNEWDSLQKSLANYHYFLIKLSRDNHQLETSAANSPDGYTKLVEHLNTTIGMDFFLTTKEDTVYTEQALYTPLFGSSNATHIMLVFNVLNQGDQFDLHYHDSALGFGTHVFTYSSNEIKKTPRLKINPT